MQTKEKIKEVFVNVLKTKPEQLKDDVRLYDGMGVDSTEMVEINIILEKTFGIKLSNKDVNKFSTLNEIEKVIEAKLSSK